MFILNHKRRGHSHPETHMYTFIPTHPYNSYPSPLCIQLLPLSPVRTTLTPLSPVLPGLDILQEGAVCGIVHTPERAIVHTEPVFPEHNPVADLQ